MLLASFSNYDDDGNVEKNNNNWFYEQNNGSARASHFFINTFLWRPLHDYDVKLPNATFYGGRGHTTTNIFLFSIWTWIKPLKGLKGQVHGSVHAHIWKSCFSAVVGRICADLGPDCSLFVKSTKFSGMTELIMTINMWYGAIANFSC